ncbi:hypothetical protein PACTADRAFT_49515 [Pachysolen tannophilus NRRL Y-2460]|uniref:ubiquitinyl hydrolase 1 n=1 Tax=Pachysolen tannophilus NRRL Y-2460 TaxID=669874 RepID=A0A1E4TWK0_PACTA|nr:hypothetical protein PACTADRAFT_49515 [Pachysolen tannophilus NRRL Y-2460]
MASDEIADSNYKLSSESIKKPNKLPSSPSDSDSSAASSATSSQISETTDDSSNYESIKVKYMPKIPQDYDVDIEGYFTWHIDDWRELKEHKISGPRFKIGDYEWNLLLFPRGNGGSYLSVYLEPHPPSTIIDKDGDSNVDDAVESPEEVSQPVSKQTSVQPDVAESLTLTQPVQDDEDKKEVINDPDWHVCAQFVIDIWNPKYPDVHKQNVSHHRFSAEETDWGFSNFVELRNLHSPGKYNKHPFLEDNKVNLTAYVRIIKDHTGVLWHNFINYNSKKETGHVGLNNQGATCYLNSLLQSYFFTKLFRKKVYQIPTQDEVEKDSESADESLIVKSVSLSLQRVFYRLQKSDEPVDTNELTSSFGWDSSDAFTQHDVQELNRILMDRLENKMKGTEIEGCLTGIFVGRMKSFIRCINVDYESSRIEDFWDIQLNVKGMKDLKESFKNYIESETLTGENQYDASGYGLQDAEKGVVFENFPPVLHLQLKRFEYDFNYDTLVKINDRHEFLDSIDLKPYLDAGTDVINEDWEYKLQGVLVHSGDISAGHYYALIKPSIKDEWFRFDDDRVWRVTPHEVFEENFGCDRKTEAEIRAMTRAEQYAYQNRRHTSAYMLVYVRKSKLIDIMGEVNDADIPHHIPEQILREEEEENRKRKEREEMHLYINFKLITNDTFMHYQGFDLAPDENNRTLYANDVYEEESYPASFRLLKTDSARKLYEIVSNNIGGVDFSHFRLWHMINRKNSTIRPDLPIYISPENLDDVTIEDIVEKAGTGRRSNNFNLYVEEIGKDLKFVSKTVVELAKENDETVKFEDFGSNDAEIDSTNIIKHFNEDLYKKIPVSLYPKQFVDVGEDSQNILLLLKYYDPTHKSLRGVTHVIVDENTTVGSLVKYIHFLMNWNFQSEIELCEEIQPNNIEPIDLSSTFSRAELLNGDVICFGKSIDSVKDEKLYSSLEFPTIVSYYKFLRYRVHLSIKPLLKIDEENEEYVLVDNHSNKEGESPADAENAETNNDKDFDLWVSSSITFKKLSEKVGKKIDVDPNYVRLFAVYLNDHRVPLPAHSTLQQLIPKNASQQDLYNFEYEVLNITVQDLENMKLMKVFWLPSGTIHYQKHEFLIPKNGTVSDLLDKIQVKFKLDEESKKNILLYTAIHNRISHLLTPENAVLPIDLQRYTLYGGICPDVVAYAKRNEYPEEVTVNKILKTINPEILSQIPGNGNLGLSDIRLIYTFQFYKDFNNRHGVPFIFSLIKGEKFKYSKLRLQAKLGLGLKEFSKLKIAISPAFGEWKPRYITNDDVELFDELDTEDHLALDHPDRTPRRSSNFERPIFIKN